MSGLQEKSKRFPARYFLEQLDARVLLSTTPSLLKDLNIWPDQPSGPPAMEVVGSTVFFTRDSDTTGNELWKTDGTPAGTMLVKDIYPGTQSSYIRALRAFGSFVFFDADDGVHGRELWRSDGTEAGTVLVADINTSPSGSSSPYGFVNIGATLYFSALGPSGVELYKTTGSTASTVLVKDINPGTASSFPTGLVNNGGTLYFIAETAAAGSELWSSGGTAATTSMVVDLMPGAASGAFNDIERIGTTLYFSGHNSSTGSPALVKSDGTAAGTVVVKDQPTHEGRFTSAGGKLYRVDGLTQLWVSNGTNAGTTLLKTVTVTTNGGIQSVTPLGSAVMFLVLDASANTTELWRSDGTVAGTTLIKSFAAPYDTTADTWYSSYPMPIINGGLLFTAPAPTGEYTLWRTDGTAVGTTMLRDIAPVSFPVHLPRERNAVFVGGTSYIWASDGNVWDQITKFDGTTFTPMLTESEVATESSGLSGLTVINDTLYAFASDGLNKNGWWQSDGTAAGTTLLHDFSDNTISSAGELIPFAGGYMTYLNSPTTKSLLWTDLSSTWRDLGTNVRYVSDFSPITSTLAVFAGQNAANGWELWKTDGTVAGTQLLMDISSGSGDSFPQEFFTYNGVVYFQASTPANGYEIWRTNGTPAGTFQLTTNTTPPTNEAWAALGGFVYFANNDGVNGSELWRSDGTVVGTSMFADINPGSASSNPIAGVTYGGQVYFSATTSGSGNELWRTNGTLAGTQMFMDINPAAASSSPTSFISENGILLFTANNGINGPELWRSQGTIATTEMLADLVPGNLLPGPDDIRYHDGRFYFTVNVNDGLYVTDGTPGGTGAIHPPELLGSDDLVFGTNTAFFAGSDLLHGRELWSFNTSDTTAPYVSSSVFDPATSASLKVVFTEAVTTASVQAGDLQITNLSTSQTFSASAVTRSSMNGVATFTLPTTLPDGNYRFALPAGSVTDLFGLVQDKNWELTGSDVFILAGDANRDRIVNTLDFNILAANFGQSGKTFGQGDFNYNGTVNSVDFNLLVNRFGKRLAPPAPAAGSVAGVFASSPIETDDEELAGLA